MSRRLAFVVSLLLAGCVAAGAAATTRTVRLGQHAAVPAPTAASVVAARKAKLDRWERSLRVASRAKPPALPPLPRYTPVVVPTAPPAPAPRTLASAPAVAPAASKPAHHAAAPEEQVTYVQAPPVVQYVQPPATAAPAVSGDDAGEHEDGSVEQETGSSEDGGSGSGD